MRAFVNGSNIYYAVAGDTHALPVVFVHGFPFSHQIWRAQMEAAAAAGFRAVAYDVRGHGMSDVGDGQYTIESHVDDLFALMDHLRITRAVVAGLSMGGYITLRAIEREPARFAGVVLCDTRSEADTDEARVRRAASVKAVKAEGSAAYAEGYVRQMFAPGTFTDNPGPVETIRSIIAGTPPLGIAGTLIALAARTDTTRSLAAITVPALILVGDQDTVTPLTSAQTLHAGIRGSELHVVPGAAHLTTMENPAFVSEKLVAFLRRIPAGS